MLIIECSGPGHKSGEMDAPNFTESAKALEWAKLQWRSLRWPAYKVTNKNTKVGSATKVQIEITADVVRPQGPAKYLMTISGTAIR